MATLAPLLHDSGLLGCAEIGRLEIIRAVGAGKQKRIYEVQLPAGRGHAIAKRCVTPACVAKKSLDAEGSLAYGLQRQYGQHAASLTLLGMCSLPYPGLSRHSILKLADNFSVGSTTIVEIGSPLLNEPGWVGVTTSEQFRRCFASSFSEEDVKDFGRIAYHYANYKDAPLLMGLPGQTSDNIFFQQFVRSNVGTIFHADMDMVVPCTNEPKRPLCSADYALRVNCGIVARVVNLPGLDCSLGTSFEELTSLHRFRATSATANTSRYRDSSTVRECLARLPVEVQKKYADEYAQALLRLGTFQTGD